MKKKAKAVLSFLGRFGLSAVLLIYLFKTMDLEKTVSVIKSADLTFILAALGVFLVINLVILTRWYLFVRALELKVPFIAVVRYFFIGLFGNLFLPSAIGGDVIKIFGLCRYTPSKAKVVASVILDRLSGFAGMVTVAVAAFGLGYSFINDPSLFLPIGVMAVVSAVLATVLLVERIYEFGCRVFSSFPKIKEKFMNVHYDLVLIKGRKSSAFLAVGMSCLAQILLAVSFYLTARALHQDVAVIYFMVFVPMICVASSLPSIGGLGVREAGAAYFLAKVGVDSGVAVSISLMSFVFMVLVGLIGGVFYAVTRAPELLPPDTDDVLMKSSLPAGDSII